MTKQDIKEKKLQIGLLKCLECKGIEMQDHIRHMRWCSGYKPNSLPSQQIICPHPIKWVSKDGTMVYCEECKQEFAMPKQKTIPSQQIEKRLMLYLWGKRITRDSKKDAKMLMPFLIQELEAVYKKSVTKNDKYWVELIDSYKEEAKNARKEAVNTEKIMNKTSKDLAELYGVYNYDAMEGALTFMNNLIAELAKSKGETS